MARWDRSARIIGGWFYLEAERWSIVVHPREKYDPTLGPYQDMAECGAERVRKECERLMAGVPHVPAPNVREVLERAPERVSVRL